MICPSCGHDNEATAKFCASCGTQMSVAIPPPPVEAAEEVVAAVPPPPAEAATEAPAAATEETLAVPVEPATPEAAPTPPPPPVAAAPIIVQPVIAAPPVPGRPGGGLRGAVKLGGLLALAGGIAAAASSFLPFVVRGDDLMNMDNWDRLWDYGDWDPATLTSANGKYLVAAGVVAALAGLLLASGRGRAIPIRFLAALVGVSAAVVVLAFSYEAYGSASTALDLAGTMPNAPLTTMGFGLYAGFGGGVAVILGCLVALAGRD
jgi:hypothetical protein